MTSRARRVSCSATLLATSASSTNFVVGSRRAALTRREFDTFYYLVQRAGTVVDAKGSSATFGAT
jgi:2-keto-4-pentenoate hydratase